MREALTALAGSAMPTLMIVLAIWLNHKGMNRLCRRVAYLEISLCAEMRSIRGDLRSDMISLIPMSR